MHKPYSQACENNKNPILNELALYFKNTKHVLEIGSGTGQHSVHFAQHLPYLDWHCSDLDIHHQGILAWHHETNLPNLHAPLSLDLHNDWPVDIVDGIFTANTFHIVKPELIENFFEGVSKHLANQGTLCIYGPFKYRGRFTSESNALFDLHLKQRDPLSGIRDFEWVLELAQQAELSLLNDISMPANNQLLVFKRST